MKLWELEYTCAAHSNRKLRFAAKSFEYALEKARRILDTKDATEHGPHGGYTHSIIRLDFVLEFTEIPDGDAFWKTL